MALPKPRSDWTADEFRERTEDARRAARFTYAQQRAEKIARGEPPLLDWQIDRLIQILRGDPVAD